MTGAAVADGNEVRVILGFKGPARCPIVETTIAAVIPAYILCGTPVIRLQRDRVCLRNGARVQDERCRLLLVVRYSPASIDKYTPARSPPATMRAERG
jgi:hypothetical protein